MKVFFKICILTTMLIGFYACKEEKKTTVKQTEVSFTKEGDLVIHKITSDSTEVKLDIEIAETEFETQTGLMYRNSMATNQGMLFIFNDVTQRYFYMKNTRFPLDIIYIGENKKIVSFQKNAKPLDENTLPSDAPAKYVLEINGGLVDQWSLKVSDSLSWN